MIKTDILVIGGGPAGVVAAVNAKKLNPQKKVTLVRENEKGVIPCGIPYIFKRLNSVEKDLMPDKSLIVNKINLIIDKAIKLNISKKEVILGKNKRIVFKKIILATGSGPVLLPIKGADKKGVWQIKKDFEYLKSFRKAVLNAKNIVIIGGGFIGVELAEELSSLQGKNISIVERLGVCLATTFDKEFSESIEDRLKNKKVKLYLNESVQEICGKGKVEYVKLKNKKILADLVIFSVGARPNIDLVKDTKIKIGKNKAIVVDDYMETSQKDIFAVGDCSETKCFLTKKYIPIMLASTACHEARIAAANLYKKQSLIKNQGTLAAFSTSIDGLAVAMVGLNEAKAKQEKIKIVIGISEATNHHPGSLPNTYKINTKLIFSKETGKLLGGQIMGPESIGEMINVLALAIQQGVTIYNMDTLQIATHPLLTAAPTVYPLITAAQNALSKLR